jgi:hypothetical protein
MIRKLIVPLVLFFPFLTVWSQERDVQFWLTANIRKDLGKNFRLYYEQSYRTYENLTKTKTFTFEAGGYYKPWKFLWLGTYYRHYNDFRDNRKSNLTGIVLLKEKVKRFDLKSKTRYIYIFGHEVNTEHFLKERISAEYNIKNCKINPFVSSEINIHLQSQKTEPEEIRFYVGADYNIARHHNIEVYYRYSQEMNVNNPVNLHTIGIDYVFDL